MIYLGKHRVIKELDKKISRGQVLHFLTGDEINDTFFYDLRGGMKNMSDTLRDYYLTGEAAFDYFVHVTTTSNERSALLRLEEAIKKRAAKFLLFLENFEWTAKLHDAQPDTTWIAKIKEWENLPNVMIVVTLKDMELLKKYNFNQSDTFIGFPSAKEIFYAYMRWLFRHTGDDYQLNMSVLDEVAHGMTSAKKLWARA